MTKKMVCIECPKSCVMSVDIEAGRVTKVDGAKCPKGSAYAVSEVQNPVRILTATVATDGLSLKLVPVRTDKAIPKKDILRAMDAVRKMRVRSPLKAGDVIAEDFLGLGVKLLATREADR
jgi:CxxC motif-containing protein